ncbi:MAG: hypothetical protein IT327_03485 [Anaerolineae bacterium]|nr:hypothetical protein [Anaerolineae bacterium]
MHAWDMPVAVETAVLDTDRYTTLLLRTARAVLQPLGIAEAELRQAVLAEAWQLPLWMDQSSIFAFASGRRSADKNERGKVAGASLASFPYLPVANGK